MSLELPSSFSRVQDSVKVVLAEPLPGHDYRHSPTADAIKAYIQENGPAKAAKLRRHLASMPQFADSMKNHSAIYNVLKRLVEREELFHDEEAATFALFMEKAEAPQDDLNGASEPGEADTSLSDTSSLFRVVK